MPAAGGVRAAFGTSGKSLQVGFAADAGVRSARLAAAGADADPAALEQWLILVGGQPDDFARDPLIPGGLAVKRYPCCYALQRPITAARLALGERQPRPDEISALVVRTPQDTLRPLAHHRPQTGLQGKFSLEYALAATILDGSPELTSWSDEAVRRPAAQELIRVVKVITTRGGGGLLAGELELTISGFGMALR